MNLVTLLGAELAFGDRPLLDGAELSILERERIGLIGRNGTGKSSLLGVLAGRRTLDGGELKIADGTRIVLVEQEPELPAAPDLRASLALRGGFATIADERERWRRQSLLDEQAGRLGVALERDPVKASGGERKRAALALALALEPDLLLLDEPTNHLDVGAIETLEAMLRRGPTLLVVTHDRRFLDNVVTRIIELDRGALRSYPGNFADYERRKQDELAQEAVGRRKFDRFWQQEEAWIRKGVEARRTRNQGRVRRLESLRSERASRRERMGTIRMRIDDAARSGRRVAELIDVGKRFSGPDGDRWVVRELSLIIQRGDRLGLIGPNGAGKTTLLRLILGELAPDCGRVIAGANRRIAYFDQMRAQLDPQASVADTISPGSEWLEIDGKRKHVMSYLGDFLFSPQRAGAPVRSLSGGERNRLLLARLFAQPANVIVLDEPTNDLDMESLELLESTLQDYDGTLLVVSHDRSFLDNVVTQTLVAQGDGRWVEYAGGYTDWLAQRGAAASPAPAGGPAPAPAGRGRDEAAPRADAAAGAARAVAKLSYREQRELAALPGQIAALEAEQQALQRGMAQPEYFRTDPARQRADQTRHDEIDALLLEMLERWTALETRATSLQPK